MQFALLAIIIAVYFIHDVLYKKTTHYQVTRNPYLCVLWDKGRYGEYQTYKHLKVFEAEGAKF